MAEFAMKPIVWRSRRSPPRNAIVGPETGTPFSGPSVGRSAERHHLRRVSMKTLVHSALLIGLVQLAVIANARAGILYDNTGVAVGGGAFLTSDEIADDVTFSGAHTITGFTIEYHADVTVNATFRFYNADANGRPGTVVAQFVDTLPAGDNEFTKTLDATQQFTWTASPNLDGPASTISGGFFSVQFTNTDGSNPGRTAGWHEATGSSPDGFFDVTTGQFLSFQGDVSASFFLQINEPDGASPPALSSLSVTPSTITGGTTAQGTIVLTNIAPAGGSAVTLTSDNRAVSVPRSVVVPAGQSSITFTVTARRVVRTVSPVIITATFQGVSKAISVSVVPRTRTGP
jgi:hypothetical protein